MDLENNIRNWRVLTDVTDSDHRLISFNQDVGTSQSRDSKRFNVEKADWASFKMNLASGICGYKPNGVIDEGEVSLTEAITRAAKSSIPFKGKASRRRLPPWWTPKLAESNKNVNNFRKSKDYKSTDRAAYRKIRIGHLSLIKKTRFKEWKEFANSINTEPWGKLYKWITKGNSMNNEKTSL